MKKLPNLRHPFLEICQGKWVAKKVAIVVESGGGCDVRYASGQVYVIDGGLTAVSPINPDLF